MSKKCFLSALVLAFVLASAASLQAQFSLLHTFSGTTADGSRPQGSLIIKGSTLYGMTNYGGASNAGAIFKINVNGTGFALLHSFAGGASDGKWPYASLVLYGSALYGMTPEGGASNAGTIFKINVNGTGFKVLHSFHGGSLDGTYPHGSLTLVGTVLYGMTNAGGDADSGVIFKVNLNGTGFKVLHSFAGGIDGAYPNGTLTHAGTRLCGMTRSGGSANLGTIFKISPGGTGYARLHSFLGGALDGASPFYGSLAASNSVLYGMTLNGGAEDYGVIFKINANGTGFALVHSFIGGASDGSQPTGSLVFDGAQLYGLTQSGGGASNLGIIFKINTNGTGFELLHTFDTGTTDGASPHDSLIRKVSTLYGVMLYGMTSWKGAYGFGTIFSYKLK